MTNKLRFDFHGLMRLEFERQGLFVRPLPKSKGDVHLSMHTESRDGWHITERGQERHFFPKVSNDAVTEFFERFRDGFVRRMLSAWYRADLERMQHYGWRIHTVLEADVEELAVIEAPTMIHVRISPATGLELFNRCAPRGRMPMDAEAGPEEGELAWALAAQWADGIPVETKTMTWMPYGLFDPFTEAQLGEPGWYYLEGLDAFDRRLLSDVIGVPLLEELQQHLECIARRFRWMYAKAG